jgi:hypothetical protein
MPSEGTKYCGDSFAITLSVDVERPQLLLEGEQLALLLFHRRPHASGDLAQHDGLGLKLSRVALSLRAMLGQSSVVGPVKLGVSGLVRALADIAKDRLPSPTRKLAVGTSNRALDGSDLLLERLLELGREGSGGDRSWFRLGRGSELVACHWGRLGLLSGLVGRDSRELAQTPVDLGRLSGLAEQLGPWDVASLREQL